MGLIGLAKKTKHSSWLRRVGVGMLALAMTLGVCSATEKASAASVGAGSSETNPIVAYPAARKPRVVIQGNGVWDKGKKATGFYELALCVQTTFFYDISTGKEVLWSDDTLQAELETAGGDMTDAGFLAKYRVEELPFQNASAAVVVDTDALTAVSWTESYPEYAKWSSSSSGSYATNDSDYPRGLDKTALAAYFDVTQATAGTGYKEVRLDTAAPDEMIEAKAVVEDYDATSKTALITLKASTTSYAPVHYVEPTPVVVIRFAYDKERFKQSIIKEDGAKKTADFWLGVDKKDRPALDGGTSGSQKRTALTYLVDTSSGSSASAVEAAEERMLESSLSQFILVQTGADSQNEDFTRFYYYLYGDGYGKDDFPTGMTPTTEKKWVTRSGTTEAAVEKDVEKLSADSASDRILAWQDDGAGGYTVSYQSNLLHAQYGKEDQSKYAEATVKFEYINDETYRPETGGKGGIQVLFYDWDDTLIGSTIVDKTGDARLDIEEYVEKNMVHPDLRTSESKFSNPSDPEYAKLRDSLERKYTYRGKYAYEVGGDDKTLGVSDGEAYPLTNKLDYVFYKHINTVTKSEQVDTAMGTTTVKNYYSLDKVSGDENARDYPYVYGWALVAVENFDPVGFVPPDSGKTRQDATKIADTWTTIGVGELSDIDPTDTSTSNDIPANDPSSGVTNTVSYPTWVDTTTATAPTLYQFYTTQGEEDGYFEFADFSDMEKLVNRGGVERDTVIVKAVYEPGESLLDGINYTMTSTPYYNKLNDKTAEEGGAYSADFVFERVNKNVNKPEDASKTLAGVVRMRSPAIRQQSTSDIRWEETLDAGGKRETLTNATTQEAEVDVTKTTYTKVDINNTDVIEVQLVMSARQNKINAFLTDMYGSNFITGDERTVGNYDNKDSSGKPDIEYFYDNYNYYVSGDSDETDIYYDATYENREGSRGFVLDGTLNKLLQDATIYNRTGGGNFDESAYYTVLSDANIRTADGDQPEHSTMSDLKKKILAAEKAAKAAYDAGGSAEDYWNEKLDCCQLSYHQLQLFIIDGTLRTRADADAISINWCHLHATCAASASKAPTNWSELIEKAQNNEVSDIKELSISKLVELAQMRKNPDGDSYEGEAGRDKLAEDFVKAVQDLATAGNTTPKWSEIQTQIFVNADPSYSGSPEDDFWWVSSTKKPSGVVSWSAFLAALEEYETGVTMPGGEVIKSTAKLAPMKDLIADNAAQTGEKTDTAYVKATGNLVANIATDATDGSISPVKFTSYEDTTADDGTTTKGFFSIVTKAYYATYSKKDDANYWWILQREIIGMMTPSEDSVADSDLTGRYYWKDGVVKITDFRSMLMAPVNNVDAWNAFTFADYQKIDSKENLSFRLNFNGTGEVEDDPPAGTAKDPDKLYFSDFKRLIENFATFAQANPDKISLESANWEAVQYWVMHDGNYDVDGINTEKSYYWWKDGGDGADKAPKFATDSALEKNLIEAAFLSVVNGNAHAWDNLNGTKLATRTENRYLMNLNDYTLVNGTANANRIYTYDDLKASHSFTSGDVSDMIAKMEKLVKDLMAGASTDAEKHSPPGTPNWYQLQDYIIRGKVDSDYEALSGSEADKEKLWWWQGENAKDYVPPAGTNGFEKFLAETLPAAASYTSNDEWKALAEELGKGDLKFYSSSYAYLQSTNYSAVKTRIKKVLSGASDLSTVTWYQVQYALLKNKYVDDATAKAYVLDEVKAEVAYGNIDWRPDWLKIQDPVTTATSALLSSDEVYDDIDLEIRIQMRNLDEEQKQLVLDYILQLLNEGKLNSSTSSGGSHSSGGTSGSGSSSGGGNSGSSGEEEDEEPEGDNVEDSWFDGIFDLEEETAETPMMEYTLATGRLRPVSQVTVVSPMGDYLNPFFRRTVK